MTQFPCLRPIWALRNARPLALSRVTRCSLKYMLSRDEIVRGSLHSALLKNGSRFDEFFLKRNGSSDCCGLGNQDNTASRRHPTACRGDDTLTVSRHRHVVTQPLCTFANATCSLANFLIVNCCHSRVEAPGLWRANCPIQGRQQ